METHVLSKFQAFLLALVVAAGGFLVAPTASAAPAITGVSPDNWLNTAGGDTITVTGSGFMPAMSFTQIATSGTSNSTCGMGSDGRLYCWGDNGQGQLGDGSTNGSAVPVAVDTSGALAGLGIKQIAVGGYHACVIASDNQAYCWGYNGSGQLGNGSTANSPVPVPVTTAGTPLAGLSLKQISAGKFHTCVIASNDRAYCWGGGLFGELGNNTTANSLVPVAVTTAGTPMAGLAFKQIAAGLDYTCAIASNDQAYCWGYALYGQLGNGTMGASSLVPVAVTTAGTPLAGQTLKQISAGSAHTCVIASDNQAYCWGENAFGGLGNGSTTTSPVPVAVDTTGALAGLTIKQITAGGEHTCVIASDDEAYCWGEGWFGELGDSLDADSSVPVAVTVSGALAGLSFKQIMAGYYHVCALASNDQAYCWGDGEFGQLGNNTWNYVNLDPSVVVASGGATPIVTVGGVEATDVVVISDTKMTFTAPPHAAGTYDLLIDFGGGVTVMLTLALTYGARAALSAAAVPTLGAWALAALALMLVGAALRRRV